MTVLRPYRTPYRTVEHLQLYYYGTVTGDPYPSTTRNFYGRTRIQVRWASLITVFCTSGLCFSDTSVSLMYVFIVGELKCSNFVAFLYQVLEDLKVLL